MAFQVNVSPGPWNERAARYPPIGEPWKLTIFASFRARVTSLLVVETV